MPPRFDTTPEKEASVGSFLYRQLTFTPAVVSGISLAGKTAIVTGSNTGNGLEVSRQFLDLGISKLILAVRNEDKGNAAAEDLGKNRGLKDGTVEVWKLDLDSYDSVVAFAARASTLDRLDIAVLNAGLFLTQHELNKNTGHHQIIQVNYLSTALLLALLLPVAKAKRENQDGPARFTLTSSDVAAWTSFKEQGTVPILPALDSLEGPPPLDRMMVSKLLGQLFLSELARRVPPSVAIINCTTPGMTYDTDFNRQMRGTFSGRLVGPFQRLVGYSASVGARNITDAAVRHGEESHGRYLSTQKLKPQVTASMCCDATRRKANTRVWCSMAPMLYTDDGKRVSERIWRETMAEFAFANVEGIINKLHE